MFLLRALIVERSRERKSIWTRTLEAMGFECLCADDGIAALQMASANGIDLVVLDLDTSRIGGADLIQLIGAGVFGNVAPPTIVCLGDTRRHARPGRGQVVTVAGKVDSRMDLIELVDQAFGSLDDLAYQRSA